jgi:hypothetical protein
MHSVLQRLRPALELLALATGLASLAFAFVGVPASPASPPAMRQIERDGFDILSDAGDADVVRVERVLADLRAQFEQQFAPLILDKPVRGKIHLLLFNSEPDFRAYTQRAAPALAGSAGFYTSTGNRLVILNQAGSSHFARVRSQLTRRQRELERWITANPEQRVQAAARLNAWRDELDSEARASTDRLARHEGAHQLFHVYHIESPQPVEPTWLTEGLAEYCEPTQLGAFYESLAERVAHARDAGTLLPLHVLLNHRDDAGFFALPAEQTETAYAESWALTYFLMQEHRCDAFFGFINHYRGVCLPGTAVEERQRDVASVLTGYLKADYQTLESQWRTFVNSL